MYLIGVVCTVEYSIFTTTTTTTTVTASRNEYVDEKASRSD